MMSMSFSTTASAEPFDLQQYNEHRMYVNENGFLCIIFSQFFRVI